MECDLKWPLFLYQLSNVGVGKKRDFILACSFLLEKIHVTYRVFHVFFIFQDDSL